MKTIVVHSAPSVAQRLTALAVQIAFAAAIALMPPHALGQAGGEPASADAANANTGNANAAVTDVNTNANQSDAQPANKQEAPANAAVQEGVPAGQPASAQPPAIGPVETPEIASELSSTAIQSRIDQVQVATDLEEVTKVEIVNAYKAALEQIKVIDSWQQKIQQYEQGRTQAPKDLEIAKQALDSARTAAPVSLNSAELEQRKLEELSQTLAEKETKLSSRQAEAKQLEDEAKSRADRRAAIPTLLTDATSRLERFNRDLNAPLGTGVSQRVMQAKKTLLQAQKRAAELEIRALQDEIKYYDSRADVLSTKQQATRAAVAASQAEVQVYQLAVSARRQAEIDAKQREAEEALDNAPQTVRDLAEGNTRLIAERADVAKRIDEVTKKTTAIKDLTKKWEDQMTAVEKIVAQPGMAQLIGPQMRRYRSELNDLLTYELEARRLTEEKAKIDLRNDDLAAQAQDLEDLEGTLKDEIDAIEEVTRQPTSEWTQSKVREFLAAKRDAVISLGADYSTLASSMAELINAINSGLLTKVKTSISIIDARVLWLRSARPIQNSHLPNDWPQLGARLSAVGQQLWVDMVRAVAQYAVFLIVLLSLLFTRRPMKRRMHELADLSNKASTDSIVWTMHALGITLLLAAPWPAFLAFLAFRLQQAASLAEPVAFEWCKAVSHGFASAAIVVGAQEFLRNVCRRRGVADAHLRWHGSIVTYVRRLLGTLTIIGAPLAWITATAEQLDDQAWGDSIGRVAFLVGMGVLAAVTYLLGAPGGKLMTSLFRKKASGILYATRYIWFLLALFTPLTLAVASVWGYHYTATELSARYVGTLLLLILANLVFALISRWVLVQQRSLALEQSRKRLEAKKGAERGKSVDFEPREQELMNLVSLGAQTKNLLGSMMTFSVVLGLWFVWNDVLPALSFLQNVNLWSYAVDSASGGDAAGITKEVRYVTLANLMLATIVGIVSYALARNLPGVLEITILQQTKLDAGARFAATALARYFITVVGIFVGVKLLGAQWSDVQWLVAAISVGLGFGLQEIFANFVSGLMMLFERPIRVGDTVTVGGVSGTVTRMRIRATTVTDWDRKELIIPNKEFITGQVINWTLSDTVQRIIIPVGIAYGSDTRQAERLLLEVARRHPNVLEDPAPYVYFNQFGDSALSFELRVYISDLTMLVDTKHSLHFAIDDAFRNAQPKPIEIAFPQQDIHIRSIEGRLGVDAARDRSADSAANRHGNGNVGGDEAPDEQEQDRQEELNRTS